MKKILLALTALIVPVSLNGTTPQRSAEAQQIIQEVLQLESKKPQFSHVYLDKHRLNVDSLLLDFFQDTRVINELINELSDALNLSALENYVKEWVDNHPELDIFQVSQAIQNQHKSYHSKAQRNWVEMYCFDRIFDLILERTPLEVFKTLSASPNDCLLVQDSALGKRLTCNILADLSDEFIWPLAKFISPHQEPRMKAKMQFEQAQRKRRVVSLGGGREFVRQEDTANDRYIAVLSIIQKSREELNRQLQAQI